MTGHWELLAHFWSDCENAWQNASEWKELWNSGRHQKQLAMTAEERQALAARITISLSSVKPAQMP
jgi:hypothetical protein